MVVAHPIDRPSLNGKIGLVTGASSGIGAACARALAAEGAIVIVGYNLGEERAEAVCTGLPGVGHRTLRIPLADSAAHDEIARTLIASIGRLDVLVNSAGFTRRIAHRDLEALDPALFNEILTTNVGGTFSVTRALLPLLRAAGSATVVTVSSVSAVTGLGSNIAYCAAKASASWRRLRVAFGLLSLSRHPSTARRTKSCSRLLRATSVAASRPFLSRVARPLVPSWFESKARVRSSRMWPKDALKKRILRTQPSAHGDAEGRH